MANATLDSSLLFEMALKPDYAFETRLVKDGYGMIAGTDEAGRGPLAGPVVAAAVILDAHNIPKGLDDSKRMSKIARMHAFDAIMSSAIAVAFCSQPAEVIDQTDIRKASLDAMARAVNGLAVRAAYVLVDGRDVPSRLSVPGSALIKGDQRSLSIAAASIIAKVMRDRMMEIAGAELPDYGFEKHAGYCTKLHANALAAHGPVKRLHRYSFAPIAQK